MYKPQELPRTPQPGPRRGMQPGPPKSACASSRAHRVPQPLKLPRRTSSRFARSGRAAARFIKTPERRNAARSPSPALPRQQHDCSSLIRRMGTTESRPPRRCASSPVACQVDQLPASPPRAPRLHHRRRLSAIAPPAVMVRVHRPVSSTPSTRIAATWPRPAFISALKKLGTHSTPEYS